MKDGRLFRKLGWKRFFPKVSILLPTHNRADVLRFAIRSVLAQSYQDFELLVVGDGCTDHTDLVVKEHHDPRIRWLDYPKAPHFGYANRNVALGLARGEFIAFMAHDDLWMPDHLERMLPMFQDPAVEWAYSQPLWVEPNGWLVPSAFNLHDPDVMEAFVSRRLSSIPAACVVYRKACMKKYGNWNSQLTVNGDWDLWVRIIEGGNRARFAYLPESTCFHFRAHWRSEANAGPSELAVWRQRLREQPDVFPQLRMTFSRGLTAQENVWTLMQHRGTLWPRQLRLSLKAAQDRIIFEYNTQSRHWVQAAQIREQEIRNLRQIITGMDHDVLACHDSTVFGEGFHAAESEWRWMTRRAKLRLDAPPESSLAVELTLACGNAEYYQRFPFSLEMHLNRELVETLRFEASEQIRSVKLKLSRPENEVRLQSESWFCPETIGLGNDPRELSIKVLGVSIDPL